MDTRDELKEILKNIESIHQPIDLEEDILRVIETREELRLKVKTYKINGLRGLLLSVILIIQVSVLFSFPGDVDSASYSTVKYMAIAISLFVFFIQLEMGGFKFINQLIKKTL